MREIRFRYTCIRENDFVFSDIFTLEEIENGQVYQWMTANHVTGKVIKDRYTGLKDKNRKEIYEGDIMKDEPSPMVVQWNHRLACFGLERKGWAFTHFFQEAINSDNCEVIGNIHQNPELL